MDTFQVALPILTGMDWISQFSVFPSGVRLFKCEYDPLFTWVM